MRNAILLCILLAQTLTAGAAFGQTPAKAPEPLPRGFPAQPGLWEQAMLRAMTLDEKIGQLFMVPAYSGKSRYGSPNPGEIKKLIREYKVGGVIFMQGGPKQQAAQIAAFQRVSDVPLLIAQDAEWGLSMRLDSTLAFPKNMTLGAAGDDRLLYEFGLEMGKQCRAAGVHINFAPVVDINNNPGNPVIGERSFGSNRDRVTQQSSEVVRGMQDAGVMACMKHFPGHGDTDTDSHYDLPVITHPEHRLRSLELHPFKRLSREGVLSAMIAHLHVPALDSASGLPASLSPKIVQELLVEEIGFKGLIFTDALGMAGVTRNFAPGEIEVRALEAGNDVLLMSRSVEKAFKAIKAALKSGRLTEAQIDRHALKILTAKRLMALETYVPPPAQVLDSLVNAPSAEDLVRRLHRSAVTLVRNERQTLPIASFENERVACVQIGEAKPSPLFHRMKIYGPLDFFELAKNPPAEIADSLLSALKARYTTVVVGMYGMSKYAKKRYGVSKAAQEFAAELSAAPNLRVVLALFGTPYALEYFGEEDAALVAYEPSEPGQEAVAEIIFGAREPTGKLPVDLPGKAFPPAYYDKEFGRPGFAPPESRQMDPAALARIDTVAQYWIREEAMPGCAVLALRGGDIVFVKGYGNTEYNAGSPVDPYETIYDLASVTKVAATTLSLMRLYEQGRVKLEAPLNQYLPEFKDEKGETTLRQYLLHNSGLPPFIPFYNRFMRRRNYNSYFSERKSEHFNIELAPDLYMHENTPEDVWRRILKLKPDAEQGPVYSDINMMILAAVVERVTGATLEAFVAREFYEPLGMNNTFFNPAQKNRPVAPSEVDRLFRKQKVEGYVNDENAALMGGYSGHAGLFSNVYDLAKLMYMLENGGGYGGRAYFSRSTIELFTRQGMAEYRRGLGWDKPETREGYITPTSKAASPATFGHLGFTGTGIWADPVNDLVYIILANRTFPDRRNQLYVRASVRTKIMDALYNAIEQYNLWFAEGY